MKIEQLYNIAVLDNNTNEFIPIEENGIYKRFNHLDMMRMIQHNKKMYKTLKLPFGLTY